MCGLPVSTLTKRGFILVEVSIHQQFRHQGEFHYFILITRSAYFRMHLSFFLYLIWPYLNSSAIRLWYAVIFRGFLLNTLVVSTTSLALMCESRAIQVAIVVTEVKALKWLLLHLVLLLILKETLPWLKKTQQKPKSLLNSVLYHSWLCGVAHFLPRNSSEKGSAHEFAVGRGAMGERSLRSSEEFYIYPRKQ